MNKTKYVLVIFILLLSFTVGAEDNNFPFPFYILQEEEVNSFLALHDMLLNIKDTELTIDEQKNIKNLFDLCTKYNNLQTFYTLNAVVSNKHLQKEFITYYNKQHVVNSYFELINSVINETNENNKGCIKLVNGKYRESIDYSSISEQRFFENHLHSLVPGDNYQTVTKNDKKGDFYGLITGGGTNSLSMIYQFKKESLDDLIKRLSESKFYGERYNNWAIVELPSNEKVISKMNATKAYIGFGYGTDSFTIKTGETVLYLYSDKYKGTFEISWSANFSHINVFYNNPYFIWSYLSEMMLLTWIE